MKVWLSLIIVLLLLFLIVFLGKVCFGYYETNLVTDTILSKERVQDCSHNSCTSKYLIYGQKETYQDTDSIWFNKWNSSDIYGHLQQNHTYKLTVIGWRIPFLSWYRNIIIAEEATK